MINRGETEKTRQTGHPKGDDRMDIFPQTKQEASTEQSPSLGPRKQGKHSILLQRSPDRTERIEERVHGTREYAYRHVSELLTANWTRLAAYL